MMTAKQEAMRAISSLPDDAPIDDLMYRFYVIDKISRGQAAVKDNRIVSTEEMLKEIESW